MEFGIVELPLLLRLLVLILELRVGDLVLLSLLGRNHLVLKPKVQLRVRRIRQSGCLNKVRVRRRNSKRVYL